MPVAAQASFAAGASSAEIELPRFAGTTASGAAPAVGSGTRNWVELLVPEQSVCTSTGSPTLTSTGVISPPAIAWPVAGSAAIDDHRNESVVRPEAAIV